MLKIVVGIGLQDRKIAYIIFFLISSNSNPSASRKRTPPSTILNWLRGDAASVPRIYASEVLVQHNRAHQGLLKVNTFDKNMTEVEA